jgi:hypothetical protein
MEEKTENESKKTCLPVSKVTKRLFSDYEEILYQRGAAPVQESAQGFGLSHALWMCQNYPKDDEVRANRWLGWVQCVLCTTGTRPQFTLDDVRNHIRTGKVERR